MPALQPPASRPEEFSFVLLADRTGLHTPGVFERAIEATNLLRPDFVIQLGDTIEGYTSDPGRLAEMWSEIDAMTARLEVPFYRIPGNHDIGNPVMRDEYGRRNGARYGHFRYGDVLFVLLDTEDPPQTLAQMLQPVDSDARTQVPAKVEALLGELGQRPDEELIGGLIDLLDTDPGSFGGLLSAIKDGTQPAAIGEEQTAELEQAVRDNSDVRWTFLLMHMPAWQGDGHPSLERLRAALDGRPHTAFAGHCHNYKRTVIDGHDHIRLGATGAMRILDTDDGDWDHLTVVTMTPSGPRIVNLVLDGILGVEGGAFVAG
jgi:3',5'-cyclic AMP phosphodiesterase CpdA